MDAGQQGSSVPRFLIIAVLIIVAFVVIYYSYNFLFKNIGFPTAAVLIPNSIDASITYTGAIPSVQLPYEGGDYTITFWMFVSSNTFINGQYRKHIFDIGGSNFSTVAIGIDGGSNSLIVRTHTGTMPPVGASGSSVGSKSGSGSGSGSGRANYKTPCANGGMCSESTYKCTDGTPCVPIPYYEFEDESIVPGNNEGFQTNSTPDCAQTRTLFKSDMKKLFDSSVITSSANCQPSPQCDIVEFDMQRWVHVSVILSGKTTDVYMDGKLARSCIAPSYYKVDSVSVTPNILQHKTFDGKLANLNLYTVALNPAQVYQLYSSGPQI